MLVLNKKLDITAQFNFIFKGRTERSFRTANGFFYLTANAGDRTDGSPFELGHFEGRREHAFNESRFAVNLERRTDQFKFLDNLS